MTKKAINVHYDRLKRYETREKHFTPEPQAKQKTIDKEKKIEQFKGCDKIEIKSPTDKESN